MDYTDYNDIDPAVIQMTMVAPEMAPEPLKAALAAEILRQRRKRVSELRKPSEVQCEQEQTPERPHRIPSPPVKSDPLQALFQGPPTLGEYHNSIAFVKSYVAEKHGVTVADLESPKRSREYVRARQEAWYILVVHTERSLPSIGRRFGNRDHTTILHGYRAHAKRNNLPLKVRHRSNADM